MNAMTDSLARGQKVKMDSGRKTGNSREGETQEIMRKERKEETINKDCFYVYLKWNQHGFEVN